MDAVDAWHGVKAKLIKDLGNFFETTGHNEIMGRILGLLSFAIEPLPLGEIARELRISKAAASIHLRTLRRYDMVERITRAGDRRDFYALHGEFERGLLAGTVREMGEFGRIIDRTLAALGDAAQGDEAARIAKRLSSIRDFLSRFGRAVEDLMRDWEERDSRR